MLWKLKSEYKNVKDGHEVTENKLNNWKFFELLNWILADKASTKPPMLVDMLTINLKWISRTGIIYWKVNLNRNL